MKRATPGSPRVVFIVTHAMTADLLLRGHLAHLVTAGFSITLITAPAPELEGIAAREGIDVVAIPIEREISPFRDLLSLHRLWRALRSIHPGLVIASTPKAGLLGLLAARAADVRHRIYTLRGLRLETAGGFKRRVLEIAERTAARSATRVLAVSPSLKRRYLELGLAADPDAIRVPGAGSSNGVDTERFRPMSASEIAQGRRRLDLDPGHFVLGFVGRMTRDKGLADLMATLELQPPECRLLLLGDPEPGDPLEETTLRRLREDSRVLQLGFRQDTEEYYPLMDLLVFPSRREGLPNAPLEAAACGVPTLGVDATGTVDAVEDHMTGRLVGVGDVQALSTAITEYREDRGRLAAHGHNARRRVEQLFARDKVWAAWQASYLRELLEVR